MSAPSFRHELQAAKAPTLDERDERRIELHERMVEHAGGAKVVAADQVPHAEPEAIELECPNRNCPAADFDLRPNFAHYPVRWDGEGRDLPDGSFEITANPDCPACGQLGEIL